MNHYTGGGYIYIHTVLHEMKALILSVVIYIS